MKKLLMMVIAVVCFTAVSVAATTIAYQGMLRNETGKPLAQNQATITFRLYDAATDGNKLWEKEMTLALDTNGLFNAELSGGNLAEIIADQEENGLSIYIGLTVKDSAGEITPRQKMITAPIAAYAQNVANANSNFSVAGKMTFNGAVRMKSSTATLTAGKINAIGGLKVAGVTTLSNSAEVQGAVNVNGALTAGSVACNLPIGAIILWSGTTSNIPFGWQLCDGSPWKGDPTKYVGPNSSITNAPDLRARFIVGVGTYDKVTYNPGSTGGINSVTLSENELPLHYHKYYGDDQLTAIDTVGNYEEAHNYDAKSEKSGNSKRFRTDSIGGNGSHENRPPFYALCYIIKYK